ncbi:acyl-CoA thioesterase [Rhodococcoides fascians]|uniref:acyl-CoA thioesterase n=1 Tax=Rhodococcoides fascians TaxID=1828 RepID=UPI00050BE79F
MKRKIELRWSDIDSLGHVNDAAYLTLLDECRAVLLAQTVPTLGHSYVVRHLSIDFDSELVREDSPVTVEVNIVTVGRTSVALDEVLTSNSGRICATVSCIRDCPEFS